MVGLLVNDEFENMWKKWLWHKLRYYPSICLEGLNKTTKYLSTESVNQLRLTPDAFQIQVRDVTASANLLSEMVFNVT
jgi:hypothetical protein